MHRQVFGSIRTIFFLINLTIIMLLAGCIPPTEPEPTSPLIFNPPPGVYAEAQNVIISLENGGDIYFTTDGEIPTVEDCDTYDGSAINVGATTSFTVLYVEPGGEPVIEIHEFIINDGTPSDYYNGTVLDAWTDFEVAAIDMLACDNNGCALPAGLINWSSTSSNGGTVSWDIAIQGFGAKSTFTYNNFLIDGLAVTGQIVGNFSLDQSGSQSTDQGQILSLSGTWQSDPINGQVKESINLDSSNNVTSGSWEVSCTDTNCAPASEFKKYTAPDKVLVEAGSGDLVPKGTCSEPWVAIKHFETDKCLVAVGSGSDWNAEIAACDVNNALQQWMIVEDNGEYRLRSMSDEFVYSRGACVHDDNVFLGQIHNFIVKNCKESGQNNVEKQNFTFQGEGIGATRLSPASSGVCMGSYFDDPILGDPNVYGWGTGWNCNTWGITWGFYAEGDMFAPIDPTTVAQDISVIYQ